MFEVITKYNKEIFCKCYRVYYKVFGRYNTKRTSLLLIIYFSLATVNLILGIIKPEIFHTIYASIFFYILSFVFLFSLVTMSDKGIERMVDRIFNKNPNMDLVKKYIFDEENFVSINGQNSPTYLDYTSIVHLEIIDEYIIILLKNKKFIALKNSDELISFLQTKNLNVK